MWGLELNPTHIHEIQKHLEAQKKYNYSLNTMMNKQNGSHGFAEGIIKRTELFINSTFKNLMSKQNNVSITRHLGVI